MSTNGECHNLNLVLMTKARAWKGVGQKCNLGVTFTLSRMQESVRNEPTSGLPLWELEFQIFKVQFE